jgi:(p)ppGpp synthase/HD superfamily hydrolase
VLRFSDSVHGQQERKDGSKYMNHIVRVILDGDHAMKDTSLLFFPRKIIIRAVHDVIEDHPHEWKNLYHLI